MTKHQTPSKALSMITAFLLLAGAFGGGYGVSRMTAQVDAEPSAQQTPQESTDKDYRYVNDPYGPPNESEMIRYTNYVDFSILHPRYVVSDTYFSPGESATYLPVRAYEYTISSASKPTTVTAFSVGPDGVEGTSNTNPPALTLNDLKGVSWQIVVQHDVMNEEDVDAFVKDRYSPGCKAVLKDMQTDGTQRVRVVPVSGEPTDPESGCWVNYMTDVIYDSKGHRIFQWDMGQAPTFMKHITGDYAFNTFDPLMKESFTIIPK